MLSEFSVMVNQLLPSEKVPQESNFQKAKKAALEARTNRYREVMKGKGKMSINDVARDFPRSPSSTVNELRGPLLEKRYVKETVTGAGIRRKFFYEWVEKEQTY